ncbi:hypothetical protein D3C72_1395730 [compost metagenome]
MLVWDGSSNPSPARMTAAQPASTSTKASTDAATARKGRTRVGSGPRPMPSHAPQNARAKTNNGGATQLRKGATRSMVLMASCHGSVTIAHQIWIDADTAAINSATVARPGDALAGATASASPASNDAADA